MDEQWPLSAAATMLLTQRRTQPDAVLRLAVKELVLVGAYRLERTSRPRRWRSDAQLLLLLPGTAPATALPALVLLVDKELLAGLDAEVRRRDAGGLSVDGGDSVRCEDLDAIDGITGLDGAVDAQVDGGVSDGGGDGGDGGGGGGD